MGNQIFVLMAEAMIMYFLVLASHSLRLRFGPVHFYALIGGITAIMSWVTDAGLAVELGGITFVVGSTVFYTSLLLGVFVVYVFDGPRATRITISTVIAVSVMMPLIAAALHFQADLIGGSAEVFNAVPLPSLRINTASVVATLLDLIFLAIAWEFLGQPRLRIDLWFRTWLTLLGVMWLDVVLFATGAFAGTPAYLSIMQGTLISRFFVSLLALPLLYGYLYWQSKSKGVSLENRPVLAILRQVAEISAELTLAQQEIQRRKEAETALHETQARLIQQERMAAVGQLTTGIAHVFNNILASLMLRASMLGRYKLDLDVQKNVVAIQEQLQEAAALVEQLLQFSSKAILRRVEVDLAQLVQTQTEALRRLAAPASVQVDLTLPQGPCPLVADSSSLEALFQELAQNALAAMPDGGALAIDLRLTPADDAADGICTLCGEPVTGQWLRLSFADTGRGISPADLPHVFEPFFSTDVPTHIGLGLSQVMGIVQQHEGHLRLDSQEGIGTTVTVFLPNE